MALRNLEVLSIARTQRLDHKTVGDYFYLNRNLCTELNICDNTHLIFIMDETMFPLKNDPQKTVPLITNFPGAKKSENVTAVACCSASNAFTRPFVMFRVTYKWTLPIGSTVVMTDSGYINVCIFLQ